MSGTNTSAAIVVKADLKIFRVTDIQQQAEEFTVDAALTMRWKDPKLANAKSTLSILDKLPGNPGASCASLLKEKSEQHPELVVKKAGHWEVQGIVFDRTLEHVSLRLGENNPASALKIPAHYIIDENVSETQWNDAWFPSYTFTSAQGDLTTKFEVKVLHKCDDLGGEVYYKKRFIGTFCEDLELHKFPFDRQLLHINMTSELFGNRCQFSVSEHKELYNADFPDNAKDKEWSIVQSINYVPFLADVNRATDRSNLSTIVAVERNNAYYKINVGVLLNITTWASFASNFIHEKDYQDRLQCQASFFTGTLFWKFLFNDSMPRKPYMTLMDYYVLFAFLLQFLCIMETTWQYNTQNPDDNAMDDPSSWLSVACFLIWGVITLFCVLASVRPGSIRARRTWDKVFKDNDDNKLSWNKTFYKEVLSSMDYGRGKLDYARRKRCEPASGLQQPLLG